MLCFRRCSALNTKFAMQIRQRQSSFSLEPALCRNLVCAQTFFQNFTFYWCRKELENVEFRKNLKLSLIRCINFAHLSSRFSPAVFLCFSGIRSNKLDRRQSGNSMLRANTLSVGENFIYIKKVRILAKLYFCSLYDKNYVNVD